ncbi:MAG: pitrilysin family protein [Thermoanaerobaculia bacterium]|nr:pitrilysin family protein [Thermoanaerobaculia bacterium]
MSSDASISLPPLDLREHRLDNGLRVLLNPDPRLPLVAVNLWYHVGSKNEEPGKTGLAHLFEHMLFQGSQHVDTNGHFAWVQQAGGVANGSTWYDRTNYYETLPSHWAELGLWLESDRMGFLLPALTDEKLENQRSVVMNERKERIDNQPYGRGFERLHELLYPEPHPYHWPVIGYMDDIAGATREDVETFFRTYYAPGNAILTLAGDFDPDRALELVERYFGPLENGPEPPRIEIADIPVEGPIWEEQPDTVDLERLYLGFRGPGWADEAWHATDLLTTLLGSGKSSPLFHDLVYEREIAQSIGCWSLPLEECSTVAVVATIRSESSAEEVYEAVWEHLERIGDEPCEASDLERARNGTLTSLFGGWEQLDQRADALNQAALYRGDPHTLEQEPTRYLAVTAESILETAGRIFRSEGEAAVTVVPDDSDRTDEGAP